MSVNHTCNICYNKNTNDTLKCKQCKNSVCDICYASIIFNNENFNEDYMNNKTTLKCAFCKFENVFSTTINNYNTNDKLIKLLINKSNDNDIDDEYKNALIHNNNVLCNEIDELKKERDELKKELSNERNEHDLYNKKMNEDFTKLKSIWKKMHKQYEKNLTELRSKFNEIINHPGYKYEQIVQLLDNTKRKTILYDEIKSIINNK